MSLLVKSIFNNLFYVEIIIEIIKTKINSKLENYFVF